MHPTAQPLLRIALTGIAFLEGQSGVELFCFLAFFPSSSYFFKHVLSDDVTQKSNLLMTLIMGFRPTFR